MPTATFINEPSKYPERVRREDGRLVGERFMRVKASDVVLAVTAVGIPPDGSPWGAIYPNLRVYGVEPIYERKGGEWWMLKVKYRTGQGVDHVPAADLKVVTQIVQENTTARVFYSLDGKPVGVAGQGVPKLLTALRFVLTTYHTELPNFGAILEISDPPTINEDEVILANVLNTGQSISVPEGQLRYSGTTFGNAGELVRLEHTLHRRRSWQVEQRPEGLDGTVNTIADPELLDIYMTEPFMPVLGA